MMRGSRHIGRRFSRNREGAAALEFALIAPLLFALLFGTIEAGWTMLQTIMLDRALDITVRDLRIGNMANPTQESVRESVCDNALILADCKTSLTLEFVPIVSAASYPADNARCIDRSGKIKPVLRFDTGGRRETVLVRACYVVDPLTPGLGLGLALPKDETGAYRIVAKSGFVNEP